MKRWLAWLLIAALTFIIGVASAMVMSHSTPLRRAVRQDEAGSQNFRGSERMHLCLKNFDVNLGDSFAYVNSLMPLTPDPIGRSVIRCR